MTAPAKPIPALVAPTSIPNVITRFLTVAASQINYREGRVNGSWNNDTVYGAWYGMNFNPWCEMYISWDAWKAGIPTSVIPKLAYTPYGLNFYKTRIVTTPQRGDLFFLVNRGNGLAHHIGAIEKPLSGNRIQTIEGNTNTNGSDQGDGVYRITRPEAGTSTSKLVIVRPNWAAAVIKSAPTPPSNGVPVSTSSDIYNAHLHAKAAAKEAEEIMTQLKLTVPQAPRPAGTGDAYNAHYWAKRVEALLAIIKTKTGA